METKRVLKRWVKVTLSGLVSLVILAIFIQLSGNLENDFVSNCEQMGYSHNYCIAHS